MLRLKASLRSCLEALGPTAEENLQELWTSAEGELCRKHGLLLLAVWPHGLVVAGDHRNSRDAARALFFPVAMWFEVPEAELETVLAGWDARRKGRAANRPIGERLRNAGLITDADLSDALNIQRATGDRLGEILLAKGAFRPIDLARTVAQGEGLPFYDLSVVRWHPAHDAVVLDPGLFDLLPPQFMQANLVLPVGRVGDTVVLATDNPSRRELLAQVSSYLDCPVAVVVTGRRDVLRLLEDAFGPDYESESRDHLAETRPSDSSRTVLSRPQALALSLLALLLISLTIIRPWAVLIVANAFSVAFYLAFSITKFRLTASSLEHRLEIAISEADLASLDRSTLPTYTVLVPLYLEAVVIPDLVASLKRLDYPKPRLDVKLLLEEDDAESIRVARSCGLPPFIDLILLPPGEPRTKPKALNYGLLHARGAYVVVYDAEDSPDPDQLLKAVAAFRKAPSEIACIQSKLSFFNQDQNLLTRWFTAEYAMWFDLLLPALDKARWPIPLGGTSNHFLVGALREVGAWDPYNVAEDADLGVRLHKCGYRTAMLDSTTLEEANSRLGNWIRQRSRWIKGYMQTWLVHMRHPVLLWKELGPRGFFGFQVIVAGTVWAFLLNPWYWYLTTLWFAVQANWIPRLFPGWVYYVGMFNLFIGNFVFTYANMSGAMRRHAFSLVRSSALSPLYWSLMSVAAWKALWQLIARPSYWEKTVHGLTAAHRQTPLNGPGVTSSRSV